MGEGVELRKVEKMKLGNEKMNRLGKVIVKINAVK
jgi:hypothetical protein